MKTAAVLAVLVGLGRTLPRIDSSRLLTLLWVVLLPLAFAALLEAGLEALP